MKKELLLALQKRNKERLGELRTKAEDPELRAADLPAITTEIEEISAQLQTIADDLADDGADEETTTEDEEDRSGEEDEESAEEDKDKENRSKVPGVTPEARSAIQKAIASGLSTRANVSSAKKELEKRAAFAKYVVGHISESEARSLGIETNNGSVLIPDIVANEIITYSQEENLLRKHGTVVRTPGNMKYPVLVKKATANANKEERHIVPNPVPETDIEFDEVWLEPAEFDALATISKKVINMASGSFKVEDIVIEELKKAYVRKETDYMFNGNDPKAINPGALAKKAVAYYENVATPINAGAEGWSQRLQDELTIMTGVPVTEVIKNGMWIVNRAAYNLLNRMTDVNGRKLLTRGPNGIFEYDSFPLDFTDAANKSVSDATTPVFYFGNFKTFHIQDVIGALELQRLVEKFSDTNRIGFQIYNLLDGQLVYSPFEPSVYKLEVGATAPVGG